MAKPVDLTNLTDLAALVAVVERGNLTSAAEHVGRSLPSVSRSLASLERDLGVELVRRTTRRSAPTPAGLAFYERIKGALAEIELARREAADRHRIVSGRLRVSASWAFAPRYLVPAVATFLGRHPAVEIDLRQSSGYANLVEEGVDVAIRIGATPDSSLRARRLGSMREVTFAAPGYLARHGRPKVPRDLALHECVVRSSAQGGGAKWRFRAGASIQSVPVAGRFRATGAAACNEAVALGVGVGRALLWQIREAVDAGQVVLLLEDFEPPPAPLHAVWPAARAVPAATRALVDFLAASFARERW